MTLLPALAIDCSTRNLGWAASGPDFDRPVYGLIVLPGMSKLPALYAAVRNSLSDLVEQYTPAAIAWCRPKFGAGQTTEEALNGVAAIAYLICHDYGVRPMPETESHVRKIVLGKGNFGLRDENGREIKGSGTPRAKAAALAWCAKNGTPTDSDDVADALVLFEYMQRQFAARERRAA